MIVAGEIEQGLVVAAGRSTPRHFIRFVLRQSQEARKMEWQLHQFGTYVFPSAVRRNMLKRTL